MSEDYIEDFFTALIKNKKQQELMILLSSDLKPSQVLEIILKEEGGEGER